MLKKFIIICLVISTFGYGMAWAFDGHWDVPQTQAGASFGQQENGDNPEPDHHNDASCDHCCHASAHLVGIAADGSGGSLASRDKICSAYTATMISFLNIPVSPPPKH
jgi:hypothetical protein